MQADLSDKTGEEDHSGEVYIISRITNGERIKSMMR